MGRTSVAKDTRTTLATNESDYSKLLNTPSFVGLPSGQRGVTIFDANVDSNGNTWVEKSNMYYPLLNDISEEPVEIQSVYDSSGNPVPLTISGVPTYMWSNNLDNVVHLPVSLKNKLKNNVVTHNHPRGSSLSYGDLYSAMYFNALGYEARMNTKQFWNNMDNIVRNKSDILWGLKTMQKELRQDKLSMQILNEIGNFMTTAKTNENMPKMVSQIRRKSEKWAKISRNSDDMDVTLRYISERLQEDSSVSRGAANFLVSNASMKNLSNKYNFEYGVYEA